MVVTCRRRRTLLTHSWPQAERAIAGSTERQSAFSRRTRRSTSLRAPRDGGNGAKWALQRRGWCRKCAVVSKKRAPSETATCDSLPGTTSSLRCDCICFAERAASWSALRWLAAPQLQLRARARHQHAARDAWRRLTRHPLGRRLRRRWRCRPCPAAQCGCPLLVLLPCLSHPLRHPRWPSARAFPGARCPHASACMTCLS